MRITLFLILILCLLLIGCTPIGLKPEKEGITHTLTIAIYFIEQNKPILAEKYLREAYQKDPHNPLLWNVYAYYESSIGNDTLAEHNYHYALQLNPHLSATHNNYGVFLCRHKEYAKAHNQFLLALKKSVYKNREMAYRNLINCHKKSSSNT